MKEALRATICGMALIANMGLGIIAEAGSIPTNKVPLHTYAVRHIDCYKSAGGVRQGWIDPGDYVIVNQIRSDGWAEGSYPAGNKRVTRWFKANDLVNNISFANQEKNSPQEKITVYRESSYKSSLGSVWGKEPITVVSNAGDSRQIIYKISGGYKMGWIPSKYVPDPVPPGPVLPNPYIKPVVRNSPITNGWYKIASVNVASRVLDVAGQATNVGSNIQLWDYGNGSNQKFYVENQGNEYFTLKAGNCDLYLSAANSSGANYTNVQLASKKGDATQLWRVRSAGNGSYYIESKLRNNLSIDCSGAGSANGTNIQLWDYGGGAWQKWKFETVSAPVVNTGLPAQTYVSVANGKVVAVDTFNGVSAIYPPNNSRYRYAYDSDDTYSCAAFVKKYYSAKYGFLVNGLKTGHTPQNAYTNKKFTKVTDGSVKPGDIVSINGGGHWAIAKGVDGNNVVIIEQNWWYSDTSKTAPKNRRVSKSSVSIYRWL